MKMIICLWPETKIKKFGVSYVKFVSRSVSVNSHLPIQGRKNYFLGHIFRRTALSTAWEI